MAKVTIDLQQKFKKGIKVDKKEIVKLITENMDKITMEIRERTAYSDDTEEIVISIRY